MYIFIRNFTFVNWVIGQSCGVGKCGGGEGLNDRYYQHNSWQFPVFNHSVLQFGNKDEIDGQGPDCF